MAAGAPTGAREMGDNFFLPPRRCRPALARTTRQEKKMFGPRGADRHPAERTEGRAAPRARSAPAPMAAERNEGGPTEATRWLSCRAALRSGAAKGKR